MLHPHHSRSLLQLLSLDHYAAINFEGKVAMCKSGEYQWQVLRAKRRVLLLLMPSQDDPSTILLPPFVHVDRYLLGQLESMDDKVHVPASILLEFVRREV